MQPAPSHDKTTASDVEKSDPAWDADDSSPFHPGVPQLSLFREICLVVSVIAVQLFTQAGLGGPLAPLHIIGDGLGIQDFGQLSWLIAGYSLTVGIFVLPAGRLGDIYGHKKLFLIGIAIFSFFSMMLGFSTYIGGPVYFTIMRACQGIGPAIMNPNGIAILGRTYRPGKRKRYAFAAFAACGPNGWLVGAVFSSLFAQSGHWPWAFYVMAIALALHFLLVWFAVPSDKVSDRDSGLKFDYLGAILGVSGMVLINIAFNQGPVVGWQAPYVYVILILGVLIVALFAWVETRAEAPLLPTSIWQAPFVCMLIPLGLGWSSFGIWNLYFVQFAEVLKGATPLLATAYLTPAGFAGILASMIVGLTLPVVGPIRTMASALLAFSLANILLATADVETTYWANLFVSAAIAPFGMDQSLPAAMLAASDAVPVSEQGTAASLIHTIVNYSISLALGCAATAEYYRKKQGASDLQGMRAANYVGIGFGCAGFCFAVAASLYYHHVKPRRVGR